MINIKNKHIVNFLPPFWFGSSSDSDDDDNDRESSNYSRTSFRESNSSQRGSSSYHENTPGYDKEDHDNWFGDGSSRTER